MEAAKKGVPSAQAKCVRVRAWLRSRPRSPRSLGVGAQGKVGEGTHAGKSDAPNNMRRVPLLLSPGGFLRNDCAAAAEAEKRRGTPHAGCRSYGRPQDTLPLPPPVLSPSQRAPSLMPLSRFLNNSRLSLLLRSLYCELSFLLGLSSCLARENQKR